MIQAGTINNNFIIGTGFNDMVYTFKNQPDGKILVGGYFSDYSGITSSYIARLNPDGSFDSTFITGDYLNDKVNAIDLLPDGRIVVGGLFQSFNSTNTYRLVILNSDGTLNQIFPVGFDSYVRAIKVQSDGKILVGGEFLTYNGISSQGLIRLNSNGTVDSTFNVGTGINGVWSIAIESDGNILCGGEFTEYDGIFCNRFIRLDTNGNVINTFGSGFDDRVQIITLQSDGKILIGGQFNNFNGTVSDYMIRLNKNGTVDTTFDFDNWVNYIYVQSDGRLLVGGRFEYLGTYYSNNFIRLNPSGTPDGSFYNANDITGPTYKWVNAFTELPDGNILMGGWFDYYDGDSRGYIVSLNNDVNSYEYQYVYSGVPCTVDLFCCGWSNYPTFIIGSDVELSINDSITISDVTSPSKKQCVKIISEYNEFLEPITHEYVQTYDDCLTCLSSTTKIAIVDCCSSEGCEAELFIVDNQYQVGDIISLSIPIIYYGESSVVIFNDCYRITEFLDVIPDDYSTAIANSTPQTIEYSPKQSCEECLSCLGVYYEYFDCQGEENGLIKSNLVMTPFTVFALNSGYTQCKIVGNYTPFIQIAYSDYVNYFTGATSVQSTPTFLDCNECLNSINGSYNWLENIEPNGSIVFEPNITIIGPDDVGCDEGWSYIYTQMPFNGSITITYDYTTTDGPEYDWAFYWVDTNQPFGNSNVDFNDNIFASIDGDNGTITITFNAGEWVTIGVYSDDCVAGPGVLNLFIENNPDKAYDLYNFNTCEGNYGQIYLPHSIQSTLQDVSLIPYVEITNEGLDEMPLPSDQDDAFIEIPLPQGFDVDFLCSNYSSVFLSTNGYLTFSGGSDSFGFQIPNEIPFEVGLPGVYLSTRSESSLSSSCMDNYVNNWYSGITDNKFIVRFEGTYLDSGNPLIYSFVFYSGISSYFDLVIETNTDFCNGDNTGGLSDGVHGSWIKSFNSGSQRSYRITNTCPVIKGNFGTTPSFCGFINDSQNGLNLGLFYSEGSPTYDTCEQVYFETFDFVEDSQIFTAPETTTYTLEVWGAQGGNDGDTGANGGYAKGTINLIAGDVLNIYVGGRGTDNSSGSGGGYNGGGDAGPIGSSGAGGGATDIRYNGTGLTNRVIVAGGGGGGGNNSPAGAGGGLIGNSGPDANGGSQTSGGNGSNPGILGFGGSGSADGGGGGGGYYGGGASAIDNGGGGGSSYLGGVQGGVTISGNLQMPNPNGGTMIGKDGNGFAKISWNRNTQGDLCLTYYNVTLKNCFTGEIIYKSMTPSDIALIQENGPIFSNGGTECYELLDYCPYSSNDKFNVNFLFGNCELCLQPFSAGTESKVCVICCPCGATGGTVNNVSAPHPTWTNLAGKAVVLLDAIQLGGMNGLNN